METQTAHFHCHFPSEFMTPFSSKLFPSLLRFSTSSAATVNIATTFKLFYTAATTTPIPSQDNSTSITPDQLIPPVRQKTPMGKTNKLISQAQLRENWLDSLSCPFPQKADCNGSSVSSNDASNLLKFHGNGSANLGSEWVVGVDPDASGAVALLKPDQSAQKPMHWMAVACALVVIHYYIIIFSSEMVP